MNTSHRTSWILAITASLTMVACELPTKLGELTATSGATTADSTDGPSTDGVSSDGTTSAPDETIGGTGSSSVTEGSATSSATTTVGPDQTTGDTMPVETSETGVPFDCSALDEALCANSGICQTHYGVAYDFPGCSEGQVYLGCTEVLECDQAITTICKDGSDEVYQKNDGCHPAGFTACEAPTFAFCGQCEALDEAACLAERGECQPIFGAPHVDQEGVMCVDYDAPVFLRCVANGGACPPAIPTICPIGQPDQAYDSPSGCIPAGFEICEGSGGAPCM